MSVAGILDAMRSDRKPCERLIWACLENHANGHRFWSISIDHMADELHMAHSTVVAAIKALEEDDVIKVRRTRKHTSTYFMVRTYPPEGAEKECRNSDSNAEIKSEIHTSLCDLESEIPHDQAEMESEIPHVENPPRKNPPRQDSSATFAKSEQRSGEPDLFPEQIVSKNPKLPRRSNTIDPSWAESNFAEFWKAFPRKKAKPRAKAAYMRRLREGVTPEELLQGLLAYKFNPDPTKQPHPATWLNDERWLDEPDAAPAGKMDHLIKLMGYEVPEFAP